MYLDTVIVLWLGIWNIHIQVLTLACSTMVGLNVIKIVFIHRSLVTVGDSILAIATSLMYV